MWLCKQRVISAMREAQQAGVKPSEQYYADISASASAANNNNLPRNMSIAGNVAQIGVKGVLTAMPNFFAMWFGGGNTLYSDINNALAIAQADPAIDSIILDIDSPGGSVAGLFDTLAALQSVTKPLTAVVSSMAASAAFAIATQAGEIVASNAATEFGSVGVVVDAFIDEEMISITSTEAPNKRPDLTTEEGRAVVREELDALHELFAESIAAGRSAASGKTVDVATVNKNFGRGSVFVAGKALSVGMIDRIETPLSVVGGGNKSSAAVGTKTKTANGGLHEDSAMDLNQLKSEYPALCAQLVTEGREAGTADERERVTQHLEAGTAAGALDISVKAIGEGKSVGSCVGTYLAAQMNKNDLDARGDDSKDLDKVDGLDAGGKSEQDQSAKALADFDKQLAAELGVTLKG